MAIKVKSVVNFARDKGYADVEAIMTRANSAADIFMGRSSKDAERSFSGGKIEEVLGDAERVKDYMETRETNPERYT